jgi:hypothetical protein
MESATSPLAVRAQNRGSAAPSIPHAASTNFCRYRKNLHGVVSTFNSSYGQRISQRAPRSLAVSFQGVTHRYGSRLAVDRLDFRCLRVRCTHSSARVSRPQSRCCSGSSDLRRPGRGIRHRSAPRCDRRPGRRHAAGRLWARSAPGVRVDQASIWSGAFQVGRSFGRSVCLTGSERVGDIHLLRTFQFAPIERRAKAQTRGSSFFMEVIRDLA